MKIQDIIRINQIKEELLSNRKLRKQYINDPKMLEEAALSVFKERFEDGG